MIRNHLMHFLSGLQEIWQSLCKEMIRLGFIGSCLSLGFMEQNSTKSFLGTCNICISKSKMIDKERLIVITTAESMRGPTLYYCKKRNYIFYRSGNSANCFSYTYDKKKIKELFNTT